MRFWIDKFGAGLLLGTLLALGVASAQSINSSQALQPGGRNYLARSVREPCGVYNYGYPAGGNCATAAESDIAAQWILEEESGDIVDEVDGVTLTETNSPTYSQELAGDWLSLSTGIMGHDTPGSTGGGCFVKSSTTSEVSLGTSDATIEYVLEVDTEDSVNYIMDNRIHNDTTGGYFHYLDTRAASDDFHIRIYADDLSATIENWTSFTITLADGDPHKYRLVLDRSGNAELFIDGTSQGTNAISVLDGKNVPAKGAALLCRQNGTEPTIGKLYEWRLSLNTENCSASGGDCS